MVETIDQTKTIAMLSLQFGPTYDDAKKMAEKWLADHPEQDWASLMDSVRVGAVICEDSRLIEMPLANVTEPRSHSRM